MSGPVQPRSDWVDLRSIQRLVERVVRSPRVPPVPGWPDGPRPVLGAHWPLADHDWHRRRTRVERGERVEELDDHLTRFALTLDGRLVRADRTRSAVLREGEAATGEAPWVSGVRPLTGRDVRALDHRPVESSVEKGATATWGTQPTGDPFLSWPGAGLELLLKALVA